MPAVGRLAAPALAAALAALVLAAPASAATANLTVQKGASTGSGTVTSSPAGIECGSTCTADFTAGATVTLSAVSAPGTAPAQWLGCDSVSAENRCVVTLSSSKAVYATFLLDVPLTVSRAGEGTVTSSPAGIECGGTCAASFAPGQALTLSGAPGPDSEAAQWSGCDSVTAEDKCKVTMSAAKAVTASFPPKPRLTVSRAGEGAVFSSVTSSPAGIDCGAGCVASFGSGAVVTLSGHPGAHVEAAQWSGCDSVNGSDQCLVTVSAARSVTASFALQAGYAFLDLSVAKTGNGQGTVASFPGPILCGALCTGRFLTGTQVALTAAPAPGSVFNQWSGGGCSGSGACTTTVKGAETVKAKFTLSGKRTLSVARAGNGSGTVKGAAAGIECGATCSAQVAAGKKVSLSAKAATGSAFAHWSGACSGTAKTCKVTMDEARSVTATFSAPGAAAAAAAQCVVPRLKGKSPKKARKALAAAHCSLGKVRKPKQGKGALVVKSSSPGAGSALPAGGKVDLKLKRAGGKHRAHRGRRG